MQRRLLLLGLLPVHSRAAGAEQRRAAQQHRADYALYGWVWRRLLSHALDALVPRRRDLRERALDLAAGNPQRTGAAVPRGNAQRAGAALPILPGSHLPLVGAAVAAE